MVRKRSGDYTRQDEIESEIAEANAGEEGTKENNQLQAEAAAKDRQRRKKRKGPRTVFYMAVKPLSGTNVVREVCRADTAHQLGKKLEVLASVSDEFKDGVYVLQCREAN